MEGLRDWGIEEFFDYRGRDKIPPRHTPLASGPQIIL